MAKVNGNTVSSIVIKNALADTIGTLTVTDDGGGGGGSFASGSFTPSENTYSHTIETGLASVTGFVLYLTSAIATNVRTCCALIYDPTGGHAVLVGSNTSGTAMYSAADLRNIPDAGSKYTVSITDGDITITTTDNAGTGYFVAEQYNWFAW